MIQTNPLPDERPPSHAPSPPPSGKRQDKFKRVGDIANKCLYVEKLPPAWRLPDDALISTADERGHAVLQFLGFIGLTSSTIPVALKQPVLFFTGVACGAIATLTNELASATFADARFKDYRKWWIHTASMNTFGKSIIFGGHLTAIVGNSIINLSLSPENEIYVLLQGAAGGALIAHQATRAFMSFVKEKSSINSKNQPSPLFSSKNETKVENEDGDIHLIIEENGAPIPPQLDEAFLPVKVKATTFITTKVQSDQK